MSDAPKALERGLRVLEILAGAPRGLSFGELRSHMELSDSACHRLILALLSLNYLNKDHEQGVYTCGAAFDQLRGQSHNDHLLRVVRPYVKELRDRTANTCLLIAYQEQQMLILERFLHEDSVALQEVGTLRDNFRHPPWGWLFKSYDELRRYPHSTEAASLQEIKTSLSHLSSHGYVVRKQRDRTRLAAPLYNTRNQCIGAIAVGGTPISLPDDDCSRVALTLLEMTRAAQYILNPDLIA